MIIYKEEIRNNTSIWLRITTDTNGVELSSTEIDIPIFVIDRNDVYKQDDSNFKLLVLYNSKMRIIQPAYKFLNFTLAHLSFNTRRLYANMLKHFYLFCELMLYDPNNLTAEHIAQFKAFIKGSNPSSFKTNSLVTRSNANCNMHLSLLRKYFNYLDIKCPSLYIKHSVSINSERYDGIVESINHSKFDVDDTISTVPDNSVPKFISPDEFVMLCNIAKANNDLTTYMAMYLMYMYGLRVGELLGLTLEDVFEIKENGILHPVIILRNRISDKSYQYAKLLMHPLSYNQYRSSDYKKSKHKLAITYDSFDKLMTYRDNVHSHALLNYPKNYAGSIADTVTSTFSLEENHYLFLNRYGRPLSQDVLAKHLRNYFIQLGISVDYDCRENGLAHRFRHGFGMFHAHFSKNPVKAYDLMKMMRHRSIDSTLKYYNPTTEMICEKLAAFETTLFDDYPELKESLVWLKQ